jgi:hypothetical protein
MTDSNTTVQAASNGDDTTDKSTPAQREHGMNRLREDECYRLTGLIGDCLGEADYLVRKVYSKVQNRTMDYDGSKGTKPLDCEEARKILNEAYECASLALSYIYTAATHLGEKPNSPADSWDAELPAF